MPTLRIGLVMLSTYTNFVVAYMSRLHAFAGYAESRHIAHRDRAKHKVRRNLQALCGLVQSG